MRKPLVSVIVISKNQAEYLERCLMSVKQQSYKNIELIVVDNFSTDDSVSIASRFADHVFQKGPERCAQFNYGFTQSKGEYVYEIGSDFVLEPDVVEKCVAKMSEGFDALALHNRSVGDSIWAKVRCIERETYRGDDTVVAVRFMKRQVFESVGGFDESLVAGEDYDLHNRIVKAGYCWTHVDAIENHIGEPRTIGDVWRKFYYYGRTIGRYRRKHQDKARSQFILIRPGFKSVLYETNASVGLRMTFYFYLLIKYFAGVVGLLVGPPYIPMLTVRTYRPAILKSAGIQDIISDRRLVSIIIACKNAAPTLVSCLESIRNQTYQNLELIVVDNFSLDDSAAIAHRYTDKVYQKGPERCTQFNYGFTQSKGEYVYRIGPDYVLEPDVVEKCVAKMSEGFDALALHNRSVGDSIWAKVRYIERETYRGDDTVVAVRFFKRDVFENVGMFDENLIAGEDYDLHNRIVDEGYKWTHVDAIENHIGEPRTIGDVWRKFYYYGRTIGRYQRKHSHKASHQFVLIRPGFRRILKEKKAPFGLRTAFVVYLIVKYLAGAAGMIFAPKFRNGNILSETSKL